MRLGADEGVRPVLVYIVRAEVRALLAVVRLVRRREGRDADRIGRLANVEHPDVFDAVLAIVEHRLVGDHQQVAIRQRQAIVSAASERRRPVVVLDQLRLAAVGDVHHDEPAVAPRAVSGIAVDDRMMQAEAAVVAPARRLARRRVHAGQPVAAGFLRLRGISHVDGHEDVIGEAVEHRRDVGPTASGVPDAVDAAALDRHEADPARLRRVGNVIDRHSRGPVALACRCRLGLPGLIAVRADVISALVLKFRRREHVARIDHQKQVAMRLQMDGPGVVRRRHVLDRLGRARIAHVDHAEAF